MTRLPSGTVTLVFTDIEGSTKLLSEIGAPAYAELLAGHRRVVREAFAAHGGTEIGTEGDSFFFVFRAPAEAAAATARARRNLRSSLVRIRVGIHAGTPLLTAHGYVGEDVHLAARIAAAGHGGQILLSKEARELIEPERVSEPLQDLGEHRLKDFARPVWLYQLGSARFPPLRTISNTNLPRPASSFVGRHREVAELTDLVKNGHRLVTLTGAGGSGKSRLALEVATGLVSQFANGVFWVNLAPLHESELVTEAMAQTLGSRADLADYIAERELLLVLDNFEQVIDAAPAIAALVERCPRLVVLVTSRELLRIRGEVEFAVEALAVRDAVELFSQRSGLAATETIMQLCRRLDNLPLAVELAAARARVLSPGQILERLGQRLDLLAGGRDADERHRTLRAAIEWSYLLLDPPERLALARLSTFRDGWLLEAAAEVADVDLGVLESLVHKSLVRHTRERFSMLETIREYAAERLEDLGQIEAMRSRHAGWTLALAIEADDRLHGSQQLTWLDRLEQEHENLGAALQWGLARDDGRLGGEIAAHLVWFWQLRSYLGEGERWLALAAARAQGWPNELRAGLLQGHGQLSYYRAETLAAGTPMAAVEAAAAAAEILSRAVDAWRATTDGRALAQTLAYLAIAAGEGGDEVRSREAGDEAIAIARGTGDPWTLGFCLWARAATIFLGTSGSPDDDTAASLFEESAELLRPIGDVWALAAPLFYLGLINRRRGELRRAFELIDEAARLIRLIGDKYRLASAISYLASIAAELGERPDADRLGREADGLYEELGRLRATS